MTKRILYNNLCFIERYYVKVLKPVNVKNNKNKRIKYSSYYELISHDFI